MRMTIATVGAVVLLAACGSSSSNNNKDLGGGGGGGHLAKRGGCFTSSQGTLWAGNPQYNGASSDRPPSGTGIKADPPLQWQTLVFSGNFIYTRQESELWVVDTSASSPVETRIASQTPAGSTYNFNV